MLARRVVPCLDVTAGRVVKGTRFLDLRDAGDPVELAAFYDREGADELVFLDITASSDAREILLDVVRETADQVFIPLTVGGGVRTVEDMGTLLEAGADKISVNSAALARPGLIEELARVLGKEVEPELPGTFRAGDIRHCFADVSLARELLGFEAAMAFDDGLAELAAWLETQTTPDRFDQAAAELAEKGLTR